MFDPEPHDDAYEGAGLVWDDNKAVEPRKSDWASSIEGSGLWRIKFKADADPAWRHRLDGSHIQCRLSLSRCAQLALRGHAMSSSPGTEESRKCLLTSATACSAPERPASRASRRSAPGCGR